MSFAAIEFWAFLAIVLAIYWVIPWNGPRKAWLLVCSYVFYAYWNWYLCALLAFSSVMDFTLANLIAAAKDPMRRRSLLAISVVGNLAVLCIFKYFDFFAGSVATMLACIGLKAHPYTLSLILPIGISFYTFETLSYTIDVYRGELRPRKSLIDFMMFLSFFPHSIAGPILRASDFLPQLDRKRTSGDVDWGGAFDLIVLGLVKKIVVADNLASLVDSVFAAPYDLPGWRIWVGVIAFAWQIYCDFSGYSDIATGVARLFGYRFNVNFNMPYLAASPTEFWRRWHISLSTWLRDYLFIPLGGSRCGRSTTMRNLMITMVLGGLWHGASWNFVVWGLMHGLLLVIHKQWMWIRGRYAAVDAWMSTKVALAVSVATTFYVVCFTWVFFRSADFGASLFICRRMIWPLGGADMTWFEMKIPALLILACLMAYAIGGLLENGRLHLQWAGTSVRTYLRVTGLLLVWCLAWPGAGAPFIYFQF